MEPATILFDGVCRFCNGSVNFVLRHDREDRFTLAPLQSDAGRRLLAAHGLNEGHTDSFVLVKGGKAYIKSTAALMVAGGLGFPWHLLKVFMIVPRFMRDALYDWVARNRYRWFGKNDQCMVPDEKVRRKFLE
jgi:predicted DCC family thiol-disulfide oxidoreductase YuxK